MRSRTLPVLIALLVALAGGIAGPRSSAAAEDHCQQWTLEIHCVTSSPRVVVGEEFTATVTAKNIGTSALNNITLRLRGDQGAPCVSGPSSGVMVLIEKLEPGQSRELSAKFASETIGAARVLGSGHDSLGWASGSCACTVEVQGLMAIQSQMDDRAVDGTEKGVFRIGEEFLYVLDVSNDVGTSATPDLEVLLTLPKELAFVSGTTDRGIAVTGGGQNAKTAPFVLASPSQTIKITFRVRALAAPPSQLVKVRSVVQTTAGIVLASDTESTTVQ